MDAGLLVRMGLGIHGWLLGEDVSLRSEFCAGLFDAVNFFPERRIWGVGWEVSESVRRCGVWVNISASLVISTERRKCGSFEIRSPPMGTEMIGMLWIEVRSLFGLTLPTTLDSMPR